MNKAKLLLYPGEDPSTRRDLAAQQRLVMIVILAHVLRKVKTPWTGDGGVVVTGGDGD